MYRPCRARPLAYLRSSAAVLFAAGVALFACRDSNVDRGSGAPATVAKTATTDDTFGDGVDLTGDVPPGVELTASEGAFVLRSTDDHYLLTLQRVRPTYDRLEAMSGSLFDLRQNLPYFGIQLADSTGSGHYEGEVYRYEGGGTRVSLDGNGLAGTPLADTIDGQVDGRPVQFRVQSLPLGSLYVRRDTVVTAYGDSITGEYTFDLIRVAAAVPSARRMRDSLWAKSFYGSTSAPSQLRKALLDTIDGYVRLFTAELAEAAETSPDLGFGYNNAHSLTQSLFAADDTLLTFSLTDYAYTGGAHGNYGTSYLSFDRRTGATITFDSTRLSPKQLARLRPALDRAARAMLDIGPRDPISDHLFVEHIPITHNAARVPGAWIFGYTPYEIGPYAAGQIELVVRDEEWR